MSERTTFLHQILANPTDDTTRLVYADWLDEHGTSDHDKATAEFIRLGCEMKPRDRQSAKEGRWLEANWRRLLPTVAGGFIHRRHRRSGRWVSVVVELSVTIRDVTAPWNCYCRLEFWRGFLRTVHFDSAFEMGLIVPNLAPEQPLIEPDLMWVDIPLGNSSRLTSVEMGPAWDLLLGLVASRSRSSFRLDGTTLVFRNDLIGMKAAKWRQKAFTLYAREEARKAGAL